MCPSRLWTHFHTLMATASIVKKRRLATPENAFLEKWDSFLWFSFMDIWYFYQKPCGRKSLIVIMFSVAGGQTHHFFLKVRHSWVQMCVWPHGISVVQSGCVAQWTISSLTSLIVWPLSRNKPEVFPLKGSAMLLQDQHASHSPFKARWAESGMFHLKHTNVSLCTHQSQRLHNVAVYFRWRVENLRWINTWRLFRCVIDFWSFELWTVATRTKSNKLPRLQRTERKGRGQQEMDRGRGGRMDEEEVGSAVLIFGLQWSRPGCTLPTRYGPLSSGLNTSLSRPSLISANGGWCKRAVCSASSISASVHLELITQGSGSHPEMSTAICGSSSRIAASPSMKVWFDQSRSDVHRKCPSDGNRAKELCGFLAPAFLVSCCLITWLLYHVYSYILYLYTMCLTLFHMVICEKWYMWNFLN